jgi:hypothetical protein
MAPLQMFEGMVWSAKCLETPREEISEAWLYWNTTSIERTSTFLELYAYSIPDVYK